MKNRNTQQESLVRTASGEPPAQQTFNAEVASRLHLTYVDERWEILAAIAWKEFVAHERGALLLQQEGEGEWDATYLPIEVFETSPAMKEYRALVESYDPKRQVVLILLTPPEHLSAYVGGLTPERLGPPEAYQKLGALLFTN